MSYSHKLIKGNAYFLVLTATSIAIFYLGLQYCSVAFSRETSMQPITASILIVNCYLISSIRNVYSKFLSIAWLSWMFIGVFNAAASSVLYSNLNFDIEKAALIYSAYLMFFLVGVKALDRKKPLCVPGSVKYPSRVWLSVLILFPFLMFMEMMAVTGGLPLLSGSGFVDTMYQVNYGKLYSYKVVMLFSIILCVALFKTTGNKFKKTFFLALAIFYLIVSLMDGKRVIFLASLIMIFGYSLKMHGADFLKRSLAKYAIILIAVYLGISTLRSGEVFLARGSSIDHLFYMFGVEFRDFAWTVTRYEPGQIPGYSWTLSSVASLLNSAMLGVFSIDKGSLVQLDSARAWMGLFNIELGIRTGIFSELWFEFGYLGVLLILPLGVLLSKICSDLYALTDFTGISYRLYIYSFIFLSIMGQSTVLFGSLITAAYLYVAFVLVQKLPTMRKSIKT